MNYIVQEVISAGPHHIKVVHPFNDFDCASKMAHQCMNESSDEDIIDFLAIDSTGHAYDIPLI